LWAETTGASESLVLHFRTKDKLYDMQHMMAVDNLSFIVKRRGGPIGVEKLTQR